MTPQDYDDLVKKIVDKIVHQPIEAQSEYYTEDALAAVMLPDQRENEKIFAAIALNRLNFTLRDLKTALKRRRTEIKRAEKEKAKLEADTQKVADVIGALGEMPRDEPHYIELFAKKNDLTMTWDREFYYGIRKKSFEEIRLDTHMTAAKLALVKPRGEHLSIAMIDDALEQWTYAQRHARFDAVMERVSQLTDERNEAKIMRDFAKICEYYFVEPDFACAAILKFIWSVLRRMHKLPIVHKHMITLLGKQGSGKSAITDLLCQPVAELCADTTLEDVLDSRQTELPQYYVLKLDELVRSDKADVTALKTFITGEGKSGRPMRTNIAVKHTRNATLIGGSNVSLGALIFDATGMRRFIELHVKTRQEIAPYWQEIVDFDWLGLWQAVDETCDDPLMTRFEDRVLQKQEELRTPESTEQWLSEFVYDGSEYGIKTKCNEYVEFYGSDLYAMFSAWEQQFNRALRGTSLTRWGRDMGALIESDNPVADRWSSYTLHHRKVYRYTLEIKTETANTVRDLAIMVKKTMNSNWD